MVVILFLHLLYHIFGKYQGGLLWYPCVVTIVVYICDIMWAGVWVLYGYGTDGKRMRLLDGNWESAGPTVIECRVWTVISGGWTQL